MKFFSLLIVLSGCVGLSSPPSTGKVFEPLTEKKLAELEREIAVRIHGGERSAELELAEDWLRFANCEEVLGPKRETKFAVAHAGLQLESLRRNHRIADAIKRERDLRSETLGDDVFAADFFERTGTDLGENQIVWPATKTTSGYEKWSDEYPTSQTVKSQCDDYIEKIRQTIDDGTDETREEFLNAATEAFRRENSKTDRVDEATIRFRTGMELLRLLAFDIQDEQKRVRRAKLKQAQSDAKETPDSQELQTPELSLDALRERRKQLVETMDQIEAVEISITETERRAYLLVVATTAVENRQWERALSVLSRARAVEGLPKDDTFWMSKYLELYVLSKSSKETTVAGRFSNDLPPLNSKFRPAYAYRLGRALRLGGDDDRFIDVVKRAFRDQAYKSDAFLRALYFQTLTFLAESPFDERVSELIEELGPRGETYERAEQLARVALDRGRPENATAIANWLLSRNRNAKTHPKYHAIKALAAFLQNDEVAFRSNLKRVVYRNPNVSSAIQRERRAAFYAHADRELARILQQTLPLMAEWGESKSAMKRRQKWLGVVVEATQDFLRRDTQSLSRPVLVNLYRLASSLLKEHPRGYAERVGSTDKTPLILGTVTVQERDLKKYEPTLSFQLPVTYSLTLVPSTQPIESWSDRWEEK